MKYIVITGSSKGLGFEMAKCFLESGNNVTLSGSNIQNLVSAAEKLANYKEHLFTILCDVTKRDDIENLWLRSKEKWGNIDIWINNAGIPQPDSHLWEIDDEQTKKVLETNLLGMVSGCQVAIKGMLQQGNGQVFNVEGFGSNGSLMKGLNLYGTTKRALTHITKAFAKELKGTNICIGFLSPGMMSTEFVTGKGPNHIIKDSTRKIFNILGDKPERPAAFLVKKMLAGTSNGKRIEWLTKRKVIFRFLKSIFVKRNIFD
jgi:short-subunit dehydrogenase